MGFKMNINKTSSFIACPLRCAVAWHRIGSYRVKKPGKNNSIWKSIIRDWLTMKTKSGSANDEMKHPFKSQ